VTATTAGGILGVFAHPDDETYSVGGALARHTEEGIPAAILCFTRGEAGLIAEASGATRENLGEVREAELRAACAHVGVTDVRIVGTADSGTEATPEGVDAIAATMRELRPLVVVTMEPGGVTRHPDHIAVSAMTTEAFDRVRGETNGEHPQRLYHSAIPASWLEALQEEAERLGFQGTVADPSDPLSPRPAPDDSIDCIVDVSKWLDRKVEALRAHLTQSMEMIAWLPKEAYVSVFGAEAFQRPFPRREPGEEPEQELFAAFRGPDGSLR
jgi:LmbE family N-acetylglucosaminyl deacetylase